MNEENAQLFGASNDFSLWSSTSMNEAGDFVFQWDPASPVPSFGSDISSPVHSSPSYPSSPSFPIQMEGLPEFVDPISLSIDPALFKTEPIATPIEPICLDDEEVEKRPKKRGRKPAQKDFGDADVSSVLLTETELLELSSQDYEDKLKAVLNERELTPAENRKAQDIRRKIKNRESARNSRQKKKDLLQTLADQVKQLQKEKEEIAAHSVHLQKVNKNLTDQVVRLQEENQKLKTQKVQDLQSLVNKTSVSSANVKKAGTALLVMLFSFGLLYNSASLSSPIARQLVQQYGQMQTQNQAGGARRILEYSADSSPEELTSRADSPVVIAQSPRTFGSNQGYQRRIQINSEVDPVVPVASADIPDVPSDTLIPEIAEVQMGEFSNESQSTQFNITGDSLAQDRDGDLVNRYFEEDIIKYRPNTAYYACSDLTQLTPPKSEPFDQDAPYYISFVVPSSGLPNHRLSNEDSDNTIVEIHCRVVDVHISPAGQLSAPVQVVS
eukprot:TRINITY_DN1854_c0_g1_i1.p1 TRINITY_DN1854_c0_g1~~TRINITY_DN1854_c0_g1_i1.p1  ORF type:complete len:498 (-),score=158.37 TRINITY_DN1854_c0_g1_i1:139-1632(-)